MDRSRLTRIDGAVLADCLFLIGQAWLKRACGDNHSAGEDLAAAAALVPAGTVEMILAMIEDGGLPEPERDIDAWLEHCRQAGAGELRMTVGRFPADPSAPALPPRQVESDEDFLKRLPQIRANAEASQAARQGLPRPGW